MSKSAESIEDFDALIQHVQGLSKSNPEVLQDRYFRELLAWALNRRGEAYSVKAAEAQKRDDDADAGEFDKKALRDFEASIKYDPSKWKALHNRGVSLATAGNGDAALADFTKVTQLRPDYPNAWFNRAEIYFDRKMWDAAVRDYSQSIRLRPDDSGALINRGHAYFQLGRFRESLADYERAVQIAPNDATTYVNRADARRSLGDWERAANDYRRAIDLDSELGRAYQGAAWFMATCPDAQYRNSELALEAAKKAIELDGDGDFHYIDTLAAALANAGRFDEAVTEMGKAIRRAPEVDQPILKQRLTLFQKNQPYRQQMDSRR